MEEPLFRLMASLVLMCGCYAMGPQEPELNMLTHEVLKAKEGIEIQVFPMDRLNSHSK